MGIVVHVGIGNNFKGAVRYLTEGRREVPTDKQATLLQAVGVRTSSPEAMSADFELGQQANPDLHQAVWTSSLSFNPDDLAAGRLPAARQLAIMHAFCQKMGVVQTQLVVVLHGDTDKEHVHLVANRVDDQGRTISDAFCQWRAQVAARELVTEFNLTPARGHRPELQHPERVVGQPARAEAFIRQGLGYGLRQATTRAELQRELAAGGVEMRETARGLSFAIEGVAVKGSQLGRSFSAAAIDRQLEANREAQQATVTLLTRMRPAQVALEAARRQDAEAEQQGDYDLVLRLRYEVIPTAEQELAADRQQLAALPGGAARLAGFDAEVAARARVAEQARLRAEQQAERQRQQRQAEQARATVQLLAEGAAGDVARARRAVEDRHLALARATRQARGPAELRQLGDQLRTAEQGLAAYQTRAEASELGRRLLRAQEADEQARQRAGAALGPLAQRGGYATLAEFQPRAAAAGYALPADATGQAAHVVELASNRRLALPVVDGWRLDELLADSMQREQALRQHAQRQLAWLLDAQAQSGRYLAAVRVRVESAQVASIQQVLGNKAQVDSRPGVDGRMGINILYNAQASAVQVSQVVTQVRAGGGEVFEQPAAARYREQQTQLDYARLGGARPAAGPGARAVSGQNRST